MSPGESNHKTKSTGPRTPDINAYNAFCKELMAEFAPEGALEKHAQTFCASPWRLNRARSYEEGMLFVDQMEQRTPIDVGHPQANNALAFRDNSHAVTNLTLYEQRLHRTLKESLRQLQELRAARKARPANRGPHSRD